jgi:hypothetical protein
MPDSMHKLNDAEVRFLMKYAVKLLPAATLRDLQQGSSTKREMALEMAADLLVAQLRRAGHEVYRPRRAEGPLFG